MEDAEAKEPARIDLLLQDGFFASGVHLTLDALASAALIAEVIGQPLDVRAAIRTRDGGPATSSSGIRLDADGPWLEARGEHALAFGVGMADDEQIALGIRTPAGRDLVRCLAAAHDRGATIGASCSSSFYLAETGLLDGGAAVTSWWLASLFRSWYPSITLRPDAPLIQQGRIVTAGAALGQLDLVLHLIGSLGGRGLAHTVARYLLIDRSHGSLGPELIPDHLDRNDALVARAERWMRARLREQVGLAGLARALGVSPRTLRRRFVAATGQAPSAFLRQARVEEASRLLVTTDRSVAEIAAEVGYADAGALRRAFSVVLGESPRAHRRRHRQGQGITRPIQR